MANEDLSAKSERLDVGGREATWSAGAVSNAAPYPLSRRALDKPQTQEQSRSGESRQQLPHLGFRCLRLAVSI